MPFPKDFKWGSATASYQIEGSKLEEGRGECIWYNFSHTPGKVQDGDTGDMACDHLHRYQDDVSLMKDLGLHTYRFSTAWARVIPFGTGQINELGLAFYDSLIDSLLKAGIEPYITLYHWDLPQALQDKGGWEVADSVDWFVEYTDLMTRTFGDRVKNWITHNEPWVVSMVGNLFGAHAPGKQDPIAAYKVAHHLMLSHGAAMKTIRSNVSDSNAGITLNLAPYHPLTDSENDKMAARLGDAFQNRWFLDPVFKGEYPADLLEIVQHNLGDIVDFSQISSAKEDMDFLGINYYNRSVVKYNGERPMLPLEPTHPEGDYTEMDWEIYPDALHELLLRVTKDYDPKAIYITENGAAFIDPAPVDGVVEDPRRVDFLRGHFDAAARAIEDGVPLKGYFVWSFMDNFEWGYGYSKRFGIIHVDYDTQVRTPKRSALFLKDIIAETVTA